MWSAIGKSKNRPWCRLIHHRLPAKLLVSARGNEQDRKLLAEVQGKLQHRRVPTFTCASFQYLSKLTPAKRETATVESGQMFLVKHWMGRALREPVARDSVLLQRYNQVIDIVNLYCLPDDGDKARRVLETEFDPMQLRLSL